MLRNGEQAPDFELLDLEGRNWRLSDHLDGVVVLTWIRGEW